MATSDQSGTARNQPRLFDDTVSGMPELSRGFVMGRGAVVGIRGAQASLAIRGDTPVFAAMPDHADGGWFELVRGPEGFHLVMTQEQRELLSHGPLMVPAATGRDGLLMPVIGFMEHFRAAHLSDQLCPVAVPPRIEIHAPVEPRRPRRTHESEEGEPLEEFGEGLLAGAKRWLKAALRIRTPRQLAKATFRLAAALVRSGFRHGQTAGDRLGDLVGRRSPDDDTRETVATQPSAERPFDWARDGFDSAAAVRSTVAAPAAPPIPPPAPARQARPPRPPQPLPRRPAAPAAPAPGRPAHRKLPPTPAERAATEARITRKGTSTHTGKTPVRWTHHL